MEANRYMRTSAIVAIGVLLVAGAAQAVSVADITAGGITTSYDWATRVLTASGTTSALDLDGLAPPDYIVGSGFTSGAFSLVMQLHSDGSLDHGTLTLGGQVSALGAGSGTLLTGSITEFTYNASPGSNDFDLHVGGLGGDLASYFRGQAEILLSSFGAEFSPASSYNSLGFDSADVRGNPVPEPLTAAGVLLSLSGLAGYLRRRFA